MIRRRVLRTRSIKMLVLDEADEMLNKGFKEQIYDVYRYLPPATQVIKEIYQTYIMYISCFGGLEVAWWPLVSKFAGSHPAEAVGFLGQKNPQHAFLRRGSNAVGPMS